MFSRWSLLPLAATLVAAACVSLPVIDGSKVPKIGTPDAPPSCTDLCARIDQLCGFGPVGCVETCGADHTDEQRVCIGQANSCQEALEGCAPEEEESGDETDAGTETETLDAETLDAETLEETDADTPDATN
ncbi:MAG TPA: hypothetical protein VM580_09785 [Labilithrix sp.]|nr:hypothetical protein [Labilithrix sp.]